MASSGTESVKTIYQSVIDDTMKNIRDLFLDEGYDDQFLAEIKSLWESKLAATKMFQNQTDATATTSFSSSQPSETTPVTTARLPITPAYRAHSLPLVPTGIIPSMNITPEHRYKKVEIKQGKPNIFDINSKNLTLNNNQQTDGKNDNNSSDDDDEDDDPIIPLPSPDPFNNEDDEDDEYNDSDKKCADEDPDPLNSGDDISEEDPNEIFDTDDVIICQYEKLTRVKNNWKFHLKSGVMHIDGKDYLFSKTTGDAAW